MQFEIKPNSLINKYLYNVTKLHISLGTIGLLIFKVLNPNVLYNNKIQFLYTFYLLLSMGSIYFKFSLVDPNNKF